MRRMRHPPWSRQRTQSCWVSTRLSICTFKFRQEVVCRDQRSAVARSSSAAVRQVIADGQVTAGTASEESSADGQHARRHAHGAARRRASRREDDGPQDGRATSNNKCDGRGASRAVDGADKDDQRAVPSAVFVEEVMRLRSHCVSCLNNAVYGQFGQHNRMSGFVNQSSDARTPQRG